MHKFSWKKKKLSRYLDSLMLLGTYVNVVGNFKNHQKWVWDFSLWLYIRVNKSGSLGSWSRVIVYCSNLSFCQNDSPIGGLFWQKDSLLQYTMTLLQGPKDHVLPTLLYIPSQFILIKITLNSNILNNLKSFKQFWSH